MSKLAFLSLLISIQATSIFADTITLKADNWCPYNCEPNSDKPGYMIELAKKAFEPKGHKVDYQIVSWNKALKEAEAGEITGVIGASVFDLEKGFRPSEETGSNQECFFVKADSSFVYKSVSDLKGKKLGTVGDYSYTDDLNKYIKENPAGIDAVGGDSPLVLNMRKLNAGRIDVVVENKAVFNYTAAQEKMDKNLKLAGCNPDDKLYITFSPKSPKGKEYAELLSNTVIELRKSGELKKILEKYGLTDWK